MKKTILIIAIFAAAITLQAQSVAINLTGTPPHASAILDVSSTQHGF